MNGGNEYTTLSRYPDYEINRKGVVKRKGSLTRRKTYLVNGHEKVILKGKTEYISRLLAETFIENPNGYSDVRHLDGDRSNNDISNLEWCSHQRTQKDSYGLGINAPGGNEPPRPIVVLETGIVYPSVRACAKDNHISASGIRKCLKGEYKSYKGLHFKDWREWLYPPQE